MSDPSDVVGHKTFDTGQRDKHGMPIFRHEPLTRAEGEALWEAAEQATRARAERMPDVASALQVLQSAHTRLCELGWRDAIYCPKDGSSFEVIEAGSTGIHRAHYQGEWPSGSWWCEDGGDLWPSRPILFRLYPEDEAKRQAKMKAAKEAYAASINEQ